MKEQRVIITNNDSSVDVMIDKGWTVANVVAGHPPKGPDVFKDLPYFCFILERTK
jgi:hypothetical protein